MNAPQNNDHDIRVTVDGLESFAKQCDEWIERLVATRDAVVDAAHFAPPSADPASVRTTHRLAVNGQEDEGTPAAQIAETITELRRQSDRAREIAKSYRDAERATILRLRAKGVPD